MPRADRSTRRGVPFLGTVAATVALVLAGTVWSIPAVAAGVPVTPTTAVRTVAATASTDPLATANCSAGRVLSVIAHPDDDLLFQGTDLRTAITSGACVRTVVVTAADAGYPASYWQARQTGLIAAYAGIAGVGTATLHGTLAVAGKPLQLETLAANPRISLVFMDLPDGNVEGNGFWATGYKSLQQLYQGSLSTLSTVADAPDAASYTLSQLRSTVSGLLTEFAPTEVHTLDYAGKYGDGDHSDHHTVAYLTNAAQQQYRSSHTFRGYLGYPIANRPTNLTTQQVADKSSAFFTYAAHDDLTCATWTDCAPRPESSWLLRQYTVGQADPAQPTNPSVPGSSKTDVTGSASVSASAENPADGQTAVKAVDGVVSGYPANPSAEWVAPGGGVGTWIQLGWSSPQALTEVDLADRPNTADQVTGGTLTFSDGSSVTVPALANAGGLQAVTFSARSVSWVRFTVTAVSSSTVNIGLSEIRAYTAGTAASPTPTPTPSPTPSPSPTPTPTPTPSASLRDVTGTATPTASADNPADGQTVAKAVDGVVSGYPANPSAEWVAPGGGAGTWIRLTWTSPVPLQRIELHDRPNTVDQVTSGTLTFSDGSAVSVGSLPNDGSTLNVDFASRSVTWVRFTVGSVSASTLNAGLAEVRAWATS